MLIDFPFLSFDFLKNPAFFSPQPPNFAIICEAPLPLTKKLKKQAPLPWNEQTLVFHTHRQQPPSPFTCMPINKAELSGNFFFSIFYAFFPFLKLMGRVICCGTEFIVCGACSGSGLRLILLIVELNYVDTETSTTACKILDGENFCCAFFFYLWSCEAGFFSHCTEFVPTVYAFLVLSVCKDSLFLFFCFWCYSTFTASTDAIIELESLLLQGKKNVDFCGILNIKLTYRIFKVLDFDNSSFFLMEFWTICNLYTNNNDCYYLSNRKPANERLWAYSFCFSQSYKFYLVVAMRISQE